jgi:hypothetical protein
MMEPAGTEETQTDDMEKDPLDQQRLNRPGWHPWPHFFVWPGAGLVFCGRLIIW